MSYLGRVTLKASNVKRYTGTPGAVSTITFTTLGFTPLNEQSTIITVNGIKQHDTAYTFSGTAINFTSALAVGDEVEVIGILEVGQALVPGDSVVTSAHLNTTVTKDGTKFLRDDFNWSTVDALPTQTTHSGKFLTTNGSAASWATVDALPSQTSQSGKFLTTDGTNASWDTVSSNTTNLGMYEHAHTISANYSIASTNNAITAGPISIGASVSITVPSTSTWVVV